MLCKTYNLKLWNNMYLSKGLKIEHFLSPTRFVDLVLNSVINPLKSQQIIKRSRKECK